MIELLAGVLVASAVGSLHCIGMCGGFVAFYAGADQRPSPWPHLAYNGGRLATYVGLGAAAGAVGAALDLAGAAGGLTRTAALVAGTLMLAWGAVLLFDHLTGRSSAAAPRWLTTVLGRLAPGLGRRPPLVRALFLGLASTLLPCGWLYGFAAAAAGTGGAGSGALVMLFFWAGTLPAMLFAGVSMRWAARALGPKLGLLMPLLLLLIGLTTLAGRSPSWPGALG